MERIKNCTRSYRGDCILRGRVDSEISSLDPTIPKNTELVKRLAILRGKKLQKPNYFELEKLIEGNACENCPLKRRNNRATFSRGT